VERVGKVHGADIFLDIFTFAIMSQQVPGLTNLPIWWIPGALHHECSGQRAKLIYSFTISLMKLSEQGQLRQYSD
jgi:hypothetical protein